MRAQYKVWLPEILLKTVGVLCALLFLARPKCRLVVQPMSYMSLGSATNVVYVALYCDQCHLCRFVLWPKKRHCRLCRVVRPQKRQCRLCHFVLRPKKRHCCLCRFVLQPQKWHCCLCCLIVQPQKRHCCFELQPKKRMSLQTATTETHTFNNDEIVADVGFS